MIRWVSGYLVTVRNFFHTSDQAVWDYVRRFGEWVPYEHRVLASVGEKLVPVPVNITTVKLLFGEAIANEEEMRRWLSENRRIIPHPKDSEESALSRVGERLYKALFEGYTRKQWDMAPSELAPSVLERIPRAREFR